MVAKQLTSGDTLRNRDITFESFDIKVKGVVLTKCDEPFVVFSPICKENRISDFTFVLFNEPYEKRVIQNVKVGLSFSELVCPEVFDHWLPILTQAFEKAEVIHPPFESIHTKQKFQCAYVFPVESGSKRLVGVLFLTKADLYNANLPVGSVTIKSDEIDGLKELTPLTEKILEKYRIQLSDVVLFVVLPLLEPQRLSKLAQGHLSELVTPK